MEVISKTTIYNSVRGEILEQKKCQFQLLGVALTFSAGIFAWGVTKTEYIAPVFIAPMLMNVLSLIIIMDKAASIQRMVGYLQLLESDTSREAWMWEYHLNIFRGLPKAESEGIIGKAEGNAANKNSEAPDEKNGNESQKHKYIKIIALMFLLLNILSLALYSWKSYKFENSGITDVIMHMIVLLLNLVGFFIIFDKWSELVGGYFTAQSIRTRWMKALDRSDEEINIARDKS